MSLIDAAILDAALAVLARPPRVPSDLDLFSSNPLFGQPGIYPDGSPMVPAVGAPPTEGEGRRLLEEVLRARPLHPEQVDRALDRFAAPALVAVAPDAGVRSALLMLTGTVADAALVAFPRDTAARTLRYGAPASPGRVVGPPAGPRPTDDAAGDRVVNERYQGEHPALVSASLAHDLLWAPTMTAHATETVLHALVAMVHLQLVAAVPALARTGTELARRQNSLAITLLNSRSPGSPRISLVAPDGPGTIPGGASGMQTTDFWSVPFAPIGTDEVSPLVARVIDSLVAGAPARPDPRHLDERIGAWLSRHLGDRWFSPRDHVRVAVTLGLVDPADIAAEAGVASDEVAAALALAET